MKLSRCYHFVCWALAGLVLSEPTAAMTLGRLRGASVLGQPLALTVPLQTSADEDVGSLCVAAEAYFGESQVEPSSVTARLEGGPGSALIRVSVRKPVDEPVVTVYLKLGCLQQSTRKYVLLSEFSSEVEAPQVPVLGAAVVAKEVVRANPPSMAAIGSNAPLPPAQPAGKRSPKAKSVADSVAPKVLASSEFLQGTEKTTAAAPSQSKTPSSKKKGVTAGGARLKLLPLELTQDWEPSLRWTDALPAPAGDVDAQKRAQAAALWHVINATPEEILQEASRRSTLEAELNGLVASSRANQQAIAELNQQLKAAQEGRLSNPVVYVLLFLLVASGAGMAVLVRLRRGDGAGGKPWWLGAGEVGVSGTYASAESDEGRDWSVHPHQASGHAHDPVKPERASIMPAEVDIPLPDSGLPTGTSMQQADTNPSGAAMPRQGLDSRPMDFIHSNLGALRAINTHEMVDVRQQADFFLALGQHDEAIGVLYGALSQSTESNPHVYLDLIALLHKLSRKDEYEKVRHALNALYTCHVPAYGEYSVVGRGLLEYPDLLMPLVKLWPTAVAMEYVEKCLVREDTDAADSGIDMEAFKDLLLLHGILGSVVVPAPQAVWHCPPRTLPALQNTQPFLATRGFSAVSKPSVDLDLSDEG